MSDFLGTEVIVLNSQFNKHGAEGDFYFTDEFLNRLCSLLSDRENTSVQLKHIQSIRSESVMISSNSSRTALYFLVEKQRTLVIRYATFSYSRKGTLTAILKMLQEQLNGAGVTTLRVENVITPQMHCWCSKQGLSPVEALPQNADRFGVSYSGALYSK